MFVVNEAKVWASFPKKTSQFSVLVNRVALIVVPRVIHEPVSWHIFVSCAQTEVIYCWSWSFLLPLTVKYGGESCYSGDQCPRRMMCKRGKCQCSDGKDMTMTDDGRFCLRKRERLLGQSCNSYTNICFHPTGEISLIFYQTIHFWLVYAFQKIASVYSHGCKVNIFVRRIGHFLCRFIFTVNVSINIASHYSYRVWRTNGRVHRWYL